MSEQEKSGDVIRATISGDVSGQVAVGKEIIQTQTIGATPPEVTGVDLAALRQVLADMKAQVEVEAPPERRNAALGKVAELEQAVTAQELSALELATMETVQLWFSKHLPELAGAVTSVLVHPALNKLIQAAGDDLAAEFRRRFSGKLIAQASDETLVKRTPEQEHLAKLRQILATRFDEGELRTLCFDLGIKYDDLPGEGNANKARELIAYLDRHGRISGLVRIGKQLRPDVSWESAPGSLPEPPS